MYRYGLIDTDSSISCTIVGAHSFDIQMWP